MARVTLLSTLFSTLLSTLLITLGCDDETQGLSPADPIIPSAGEVTGGDTPNAGTAISGGATSQSGATAGSMAIAGEMRPNAGESAGESAGQCAVSCEESEGACEALTCTCPDGRSSSFDGCVEGCCASAESDTTALCEALCESLPPRECTPGESRCLEAGSTAIQRCNPAGEWSLGSCNADEVCALEQCLPLECAEGQSRCLSPSQVAICSGGQWALGEMCDGGACANGVCQSLECAQASLERSYLGCEYLTLELPNTTNLSGNHSPTAVVITNPSLEESAIIQMFGPDGAPSALITEQLVSVPPIDGLPQGMYLDQTIRSEVQDAEGRTFENMVLRPEMIAIPPGGIGTFLLPKVDWPLEGSIVKRAAHRVVSDRPVGAYQFSPYCCNFSFSNDASLLIPTSALGKEYLYLGVPTLRGDTFSGDFVYPATGVIVATRDQTEVRFTTPQADILQVETEGRLRRERGEYIVTLDQQETLLLRLRDNPPPIFGEVGPQPDLTGAFIESTEPVALFSAHECSFYPSILSACDHLEEQLFPLDTWGSEFLLIPPRERGDNVLTERIYWKIIAQSSGARLQLSAPFADIGGAGPGSPGVPDCGQLLDSDGATIVLGTQGYCEFSTKEPVGLSADQGIMVMGILSGQSSVNPLGGFGERLGDPSIFLVPPARQARRDYAFLTPSTYYTDFATLTFADGTTITLDGEELDLSGAQSIPGVPQKYIYVDLEDGAHKIEGSGPFSIMVIAYDDFVSYAFTGGLNLSKR